MLPAAGARFDERFWRGGGVGGIGSTVTQPMMEGDIDVGADKFRNLKPLGMSGLPAAEVPVAPRSEMPPAAR